jgi:phosphoglycolate phosphatase-like HAD superfamily hydrolase
MSYKKSKHSQEMGARHRHLKLLLQAGRWDEVRSLATRMLADSPTDALALRASAEVDLAQVTMKPHRTIVRVSVPCAPAIPGRT